MKVLLCDDHELFREGLKQLIQLHHKHADIIEASSMAEIERQSELHIYSLVLLDLNMPGLNGVATLSKVCQLFKAPVLVISADNRAETIQLASKQGIAGYLSKDTDSQTILLAIEKILAGEKYFPQQIIDSGDIIGNINLNPRQLEILHRLIDGKSNQEIADTLNLSEGTVRQYVSVIFKFLGVSNRTQAANAGRKLLNETSF